MGGAGTHQGQSSAVQESEQAGRGDDRRQAGFGHPAWNSESRSEAGWLEAEGTRMMRYMVVVERGESSWGAHVPDLPGCIVVGESRDQVVHLIRDAIALHIESLKQDGLPVPAPISEGEYVEVEAA